MPDAAGGGSAAGDWLVSDNGKLEVAGPAGALPPAEAVAPILAAGLRAAELGSATAGTYGGYQCVPAGAEPLAGTAPAGTHW